MKNILNHLFNHKYLTRNEAKEILLKIAKAEYNECEIAAFLTVYIMRSISVEELTGFRDALLELCVRVDLSDFDIIDMCGTGGDGKNTINISTLSSFVVAGAGYKVAKHGNYGVSSGCGSSNILEHFGYQFTNRESKLKKMIDQANICFLHAPLFNPAMKNVAPIRKALKVKTFFNMLGPMVNPAFPKKQLIGVFSLDLARLYNYIHQKLDKQYIIVHSLDGYDEISLTSAFKIISNSGEKTMQASDFCMKQLIYDDIAGGETVEKAAQNFIRILEGKGTEAQNNVILANSAMAIKCYHPQKKESECIEIARKSIIDGKALKSFQKLIELSAE